LANGQNGSKVRIVPVEERLCFRRMAAIVPVNPAQLGKKAHLAEAIWQAG
jgi:hypothetical protein